MHRVEMACFRNAFHTLDFGHVVICLLYTSGLEERLLRQNDRAVPQIVMGRRSDQIDLLSQREYDLPPFSQAALPFQMVLPPSVIPPVDRAQESFQGCLLYTSFLCNAVLLPSSQFTTSPLGMLFR